MIKGSDKANSGFRRNLKIKKRRTDSTNYIVTINLCCASGKTSVNVDAATAFPARIFRNQTLERRDAEFFNGNPVQISDLRGRINPSASLPEREKPQQLSEEVRLATGYCIQVEQ